MAFPRSSRRMVSCTAAAVLLISGVAVGIALAPPSSAASGTVLFNQPFNDNTVDGPAGSVALPAVQSGTNGACLTAAGNATANPLASCATATDPQGSGTLRLTPDTGGKVGAVFAKTTVPTSQGLDITFNLYQYGTATPSGADGTAFVLAAVNPADPSPPSTAGPSGGSLGYSAQASNSLSGLSDGYAAVGFDEHGNYSNPTYQGSGCTNQPNINGTMPGQVVLRGPGNGTVGYCGLFSSAVTSTSPPLTLRANTRAASKIPIEVVVNPTSSSVTTPSGLVVPAGDGDVEFTPVGGPVTNRLGPLPAVPAGLYPSSWVNANGIPKQLAFGWVASTGASVDYHEIGNAVVTTLNPVPTLGVSQTSYAGSSLAPGSPVTYQVAATSSGAAENSPVTVTETLPAGVLPVGAEGTGWVCGAPAGQSISCTSSSSPFTSGTITVNGVVNTTGVTAAIIQSSSTAVASSSDAGTATSTSAPAGTIPSAPVVTSISPTNGASGGGNDVTVTGTNLSGATAIEIGTTAEFAAGTPATLNLCAASAAGCFTVTSDTSLDISSMPAHITGAVTVKVVSLGIAGSSSYTYNPGPALLFPAPPGGEAGVAYSDQLTVTGGTSPFTWTVSTGSLPPGLTLSGTGGLLSGTPTTAGTYTFTVKVTDSASLSDTEPVTITIIPGPSLNFPAPPAGWTRTPYSDQLTVSGGTSPFTWSVSSGSLPAGISLSADGNLSGTPTATGTYSFTVKVSDANSQTATQATSITISTGVSTTFTAPPAGEINTAYSDTLTATGGTAPYVWLVNAGSLPPGITLSTAGVLAGTPTSAGSYSFSVNVIDQNGGIATTSITLVIAAGPVLNFAAPPSGEVGAAYSYTLIASGGTGPYAWSVNAGSLPTGITLNASSGILSGTPTAAGTSNFTIMVTDANSQTATQATSLTVVAGPSLSFPTPPPGEVGVAYSDTLTVSGGTGPYAWSVSTGSLPAGITLNASTGILSGTPTAAGTFSFTVKVTDSGGQSATQATSLTVAAGPVLNFAAPPSGEVGAAYSYTLIASGGTGPYAWSVSAGSLPGGITLNSASGVLSGTPTAAGTSNFTIMVTDAAGQTATQATSLTVVLGPSLSFPAPPSGEIGAAYSYALTASGGTGPYAWSVSAGSLPAGITLNASTGVLSGTPTTAGTSNFTIKVTDANSQAATQATSLTIISGPGLSFPAPPPGEVGAAYSYTLTASGGTGPYAWSVSAGSLPAGITLNSASGLLSGTPTAAGTSNFTIKVTDAAGQAATQATSLAIVSGPSLSFPAPPSGEIGVAYSYTLTASGGTGPYAWSVSSGSLPAGITLNSASGLLSGTPTAAGTAAFTIKVTDAAGQAATQATSLTIISGPTLSFAAPPAGEIGAAYSYTLTASGGTGPYAWSVSGGSLPAGITLNASTGLLSGTPTAAGTSNFTIKVTDANSQTATQATSLAIVSGPSLSFPAPPAGQNGAAYSDTLTVTGGLGPYTWSVSGGSLPAGITLGASTGVLAGTPTGAGTSNFTIKVTDAGGLTATQATSLVIIPSTALTTSSNTVTFGHQVTLTAAMTPAAATGSVTFTDKLSSGPQSGQTVTLGTTTLSGGTATLATTLPAFGANKITAIYSGDLTYASAASAPSTIQVNAYTGEILISQFRLSGPGGAADQYAQLYNTGPAVPLAGFTLAARSGATVTIPASAPTLATGQSYLITGASYSLSAVAASDQSAATLGTTGLQLSAPDGAGTGVAGTITDAAGSTGAGTGFHTGTPLPALTGTPAGQYAWVRLIKSGVPVNTGSNAADFQLVSTSGGLIGGVQSCLGSPSPQATGSPAQANTSLLSTLLDPGKGTLAIPNYFYVPGSPGSLTIRRTLTNSSSATITTADLRITSLSEANGPPEPGVPTQPPVPAQLRIINPATPTSQFTITGGHAVTVHNLSVDPPATASPGGGLNTTLSIPLPTGGLAPGATISIALSFAVDRHGPYWYGYNIDALSAPASAPSRHTRTRHHQTTPPTTLLHPAKPGPSTTGHGTLP